MVLTSDMITSVHKNGTQFRKRGDKLNRRQYDYNRLRGRIREKLGTETRFAEAINRSRTQISRVLRNEAYFSQGDITQSVEILDIPQDEIGAYFFTKQVHKSETEVNEMH